MKQLLDGLFAESQQQLRHKSETFRIKATGAEFVIGKEERTTQNPLGGWETSRDEEAVIVACCGRAVSSTQDIAGVCCKGEFLCRECFLVCNTCGSLCCRLHSKIEKDGAIACRVCWDRGKWKRILLALLSPFIEKVER